jgi:AmmeMemoRadiSam system protein B
VEALVEAFDADGLMRQLEAYPEDERGRCVMCGGGPAVAVMQRAAVLARTHSGHVSGDLSRVVGYLAAAFGREETA